MYVNLARVRLFFVYCTRSERAIQALEQSADCKERHPSDFEGLSVCALPATDITQPWLSPTTGVATVSVTESPEAIYKLLCTSGRTVVDKLEKQKIVTAGVEPRTPSLPLPPTRHHQAYEACLVSAVSSSIQPKM